MEFLLGCDPEAFLADVNGHLKASCGLIGGTKRHPQPIKALGDGFAVQEDNVAIEFNIPPAKSEREFTNSVQRVLKVLGDGVNSKLGFHIVNVASASFPEEELQSKAAKEFGCDPDFNAWTGEQNPRPAASDKNLRSCGGHLHIGYDKSKVDPRRVIQFMDMFVGVPSTLMDTDTTRRNLYGKHGAYREKKYGVEYRTPSNFWIFHPRLTKWAYENSLRAYNLAQSPVPIELFRDRIVDAIDNNNRETAIGLVKEFNLEVVNV